MTAASGQTAETVPIAETGQTAAIAATETTEVIETADSKTGATGDVIAEDVVVVHDAKTSRNNRRPPFRSRRPPKRSAGSTSRATQGSFGGLATVISPNPATPMYRQILSGNSRFAAPT